MSGGQNRWTWVKSIDDDLNDWYASACFVHWLSFASVSESNPNCCFLCFEICFTKISGMFVVVFLAPIQSKLMSSFLGKAKLKSVLYLIFTDCFKKKVYFLWYTLGLRKGKRADECHYKTYFCLFTVFLYWAWGRRREQREGTIKTFVSGGQVTVMYFCLIFYIYI